VSRDFEVGTNVSCKKSTVSPHTGLILFNYVATGRAPACRNLPQWFSFRTDGRKQSKDNQLTQVHLEMAVKWCLCLPDDIEHLVFCGFRLVCLRSRYMLTLLLQHHHRPSVEVGHDIVDAALCCSECYHNISDLTSGICVVHVVDRALPQLQHLNTTV